MPDSPRTGLYVYRIRIEEANGKTGEHELTSTALLKLGDVVERGQDGWAGPKVAIEDIDRHPDGVQAGMALAWPTTSIAHQPQKTAATAARRGL